MHFKSSFRVWIFLSLISLVLIFGGHHFAGRFGLLFGFILALSMNSVVFFYGELRLLHLFNSQLLEGQDPWGLLSMVEDLSQKAQIPTPRVFLIESKTPTALSIGVTPKRTTILVSESLVELFSRDEVYAVLACEVARLNRHDTMSATIASALASGLLFLGNFLDNFLFLQFLRKKKACQVRPGSYLLAPLTSLLVRFATGRKNFYASDQLAVSYVGDPHLYARVLWKLDSYHSTMPIDVALSDSHLFVVNPLTSCSPYRYFLVQPTAKRRIKMLVGQYPI